MKTRRCLNSSVSGVPGLSFYISDRLGKVSFQRLETKFHVDPPLYSTCVPTDLEIHYSLGFPRPLHYSLTLMGSSLTPRVVLSWTLTVDLNS